MVNADSMNVCTELLATTLDRSTLHGKRPEAAKRKALGMGISPRALGESATARVERGSWRARTGTSWATSLVVAVGERWPGSRVGMTSVSQGHRMLEVEGGVNGAWSRRATACCCVRRSRGRRGCCSYLSRIRVAVCYCWLEVRRRGEAPKEVEVGGDTMWWRGGTIGDGEGVMLLLIGEEARSRAVGWQRWRGEVRAQRGCSAN